MKYRLSGLLSAGFLLLTLGFVFYSCSEENVDGESGTSPVITLNKQELTLELEGSERLVASFDPADCPNKAHVWSSSASDIASVDETGMVSAITIGEAVITAKALDGGKTASCKVTVISKMVHVTGIYLDSKSNTVKVGDEFQLSATVSPSNASDKSVTWKSSDSQVATVSGDGMVKALSEGNVVITATTNDGSYSASCELKVIDGSDVMSKTDFSPTDIYENKIILESPVEGEIMGDINICFSKEPNPTVVDNLTVAEVKGDKITLTLDGLDKGTTYYLRSYTREGSKITYNDDEVSVQTVGADFKAKNEYLSKERYEDALGYESYYIYLSIEYELNGDGLYVVKAEGEYSSWTQFSYENSYSEELYVNGGKGTFRCRRSGGTTGYEGRDEIITFKKHSLVFTNMDTSVRYHMPPLEGKFYLW